MSKNPFSFRIENTVEEGERRVRENPEDPYAYIFLGNAHFTKKNYVAAEKSLRKANELLADSRDKLNDDVSLGVNSMDTEMYFIGIVMLADTLANQRKYEESCSFYRKAVDVKKDNAELWNNYGVSLAQSNQKKQALVAYRKAVRLNFHEKMFWNNLRGIYQELHRNEEAALCMQVIQRITREGKRRAFEDDLLVLAKLFFYAHDWVTAQEILEPLTLGPDKVLGALVQLAELKISHSQITEAKKLLSDALKMDKNNEGVWWNYTRVYLTEGSIDEAVKSLDEVIRISPRHKDAKRLIKEIALKRNSWSPTINNYPVTWTVRGEQSVYNAYWSLGATVGNILQSLMAYWGISITDEKDEEVEKAKFQDLEPGDLFVARAKKPGVVDPANVELLTLDSLVLPGDILLVSELEDVYAAARVQDRILKYGL